MFGDASAERRFKVGRLAGIPFYVTPWMLLLLAYYVLVAAVYEASPMRLVWVAVVFGSVLLHELGHALAARRYGHRILGITLHLFGGVMEHSSGGTRFREGIAISLAGPAVNVALALLALPLVVLSLALPAPVTTFAFVLMWVNVGLLVFNSLPIYPLDGGNVARALFTRRLGPVRGVYVGSVVSLVVAGCALVLSFLLLSLGPLGFVLLGMLGLMNVMELRRVRPYAGALREKGEPGFWGRLRARKAARKPEEERRAPSPSDRTVEALLARAARKGIDALDPGERRELVWHRAKLEGRVVREGYESLSDRERRLLDAHHLLARPRAPDA